MTEGARAPSRIGAAEVVAESVLRTERGAMGAVDVACRGGPQCEDRLAREGRALDVGASGKVERPEPVEVVEGRGEPAARGDPAAGGSRDVGDGRFEGRGGEGASRPSEASAARRAATIGMVLKPIATASSGSMSPAAPRKMTSPRCETRATAPEATPRSITRSRTAWIAAESTAPGWVAGAGVWAAASAPVQAAEVS